MTTELVRWATRALAIYDRVSSGGCTPPPQQQRLPLLIAEALSHCRMKHLTAWASETLRPGVHSARREDLIEAQEEQNLRKLVSATTPAF